MSYTISDDASSVDLPHSPDAWKRAAEHGNWVRGRHIAVSTHPMRMRGLEPPPDHSDTDLNRIEAPWMRLRASDTSKLRGSVDGLDAVDGMDVVTVLSRWPARCC
jgi:hypothetical protein